MLDYGRPHSNQSHDMAASFDSTRHRRLKRMQQACSKEDVECLCRTDTDGIGLTGHRSGRQPSPAQPRKDRDELFHQSTGPAQVRHPEPYG